MPDEIKAKTILYHYGDEWDTGPYDSVETEFAKGLKQNLASVIEPYLAVEEVVARLGGVTTAHDY